MRLDGTIDDGKVFAVVHCVQHRHLKRRRTRDRRLTRFKVDLHAIVRAKLLQPSGESSKRIAFAREVDAAAQD